MNEKKTHLHFIIWSYESIDLETGNCINTTTLDLISDTPEKAMERAKKLSPDKLYRIHMILEHFNDQPCQGR